MFSLKIFFLGLIVFVPSPDGKELTVLLVDGRQGYTTSDGTELGSHAPYLLARAESCSGNCSPSPETADFFFSKFGSGAQERLDEALLGGGAWRLSESELSLTAGGSSLALNRTRTGGREKSALPADPLEAQDVGWIADLKLIDSRVLGIDPDHLADRPLNGWVVARLRLRNGRVSTYRLAGYDDQVVPIAFRPIVGGPTSGYAQALADSVVAEIEIQGDSIEIEEESFGGGNRRHMRLFPREGVVELALVNTPPASSAHAGHGAPTVKDALPGPGKHFEIFYELAKVKTLKASRAIPHVDTRVPSIPWSRVQVRQSGDSKLFKALGFDDPRTVFERIICPPGWLSQ